MVAILVSISGLLIFWLGSATSGLAVVVAALVLLVVVAGCVGVGAILGATRPAAARWLITAWTPFVILALGCIAALLIAIAIALSPGDKASDTTKQVLSAIGAIVVAIATAVNGWAGKHLAPWLATRIICWRYRAWFPCVPEGSGPGRVAQEAFASVCGSAPSAIKDGRSVESLLNLIRSAAAAGEVSGGPHWKCLQP